MCAWIPILSIGFELMITNYPYKTFLSPIIIMRKTLRLLIKNLINQKLISFILEESIELGDFI
jgi:hypothetical protein